MTPTGGHRLELGAVAVVVALALAGCEAVVLEPDPDVDRSIGADGATPMPVLGDGSAPRDMMPHDAARTDGAAAAAMTLTPAEVDFGDVPPHTSARRTVTLTVGDRPLQIDSVGVGGPAFALAPDSPRGPLPLGAGGAVRWTVVFSPVVAGRPSAGDLVVVTGEGVRRVGLTGRGAWAGPACDGWSVDSAPTPPQAIEPGAELSLWAKPPASLALGEVTLTWSLVETPDPGSGQPLERFADPERPGAGGPPDDPRSFAAVAFIDKPGRYVYRATPALPRGADCTPPPSDFVLHACPCSERPLHIRVGWRRAGDGPPGPIHVEPLLIDGAAMSWSDGLGRQAPQVDWGRPGPDDDPRLDLEGNGSAGRADLWVERGQPPSYARLGLGLFGEAESRVATVDVSVEWLVDGTSLGRVDLDGVDADGTLWDVGAFVGGEGGARLVLYDRLFAAEPGAWPALGTPLARGSPCDERVGPPCEVGSVCRQEPAGRRCGLP